MKIWTTDGIFLCFTYLTFQQRGKISLKTICKVCWWADLNRVPWRREIRQAGWIGALKDRTWASLIKTQVVPCCPFDAAELHVSQLRIFILTKCFTTNFGAKEPHWSLVETKVALYCHGLPSYLIIERSWYARYAGIGLRSTYRPLKMKIRIWTWNLVTWGGQTMWHEIKYKDNAGIHSTRLAGFKGEYTRHT